jgi:hypothetical protein
MLNTSPRLRPRSVAFALAIVMILAGCTGSAGASTAGGPGSGGPSGSIAIVSAEDAAARVLSQIGRWPGLGPFDPKLVGQCCGYRVEPTADGWSVTVQVGWNDCPAGCIDRHQWRYVVHPDGRIVDQGETGPAVPTGLPGAEASGGSAPAPTPIPGDSGPRPTVGIEGTVVAGPTCPVVRPGDPACAARPVAGATIHVMQGGHEVATAMTDGQGHFAIGVPAGAYEVDADPIAGLMRAPSPQAVQVTIGLAIIQLDYDTGIR